MRGAAVTGPAQGRPRERPSSDGAPIAPEVPAVSIADRVHPDLHVALWQALGLSDICVGGSAVTLRMDQALWIPAGTRHDFTVRADSVVLPMFFPEAQTATRLSEPTVVRVDARLRILFLARVQASYSIIRPDADLARQVVLGLESSPVVPGGLPMPVDGAARAVALHLRSSPGDDRTVQALAAGVHTSVRTLQRGFLAQTGMTLRRWRIASRMEAAAELLRCGIELEPAAHRVGYTSVSAFRRVFKERFRVTPGEYAARWAVSSGAGPRPVSPQPAVEV